VGIIDHLTKIRPFITIKKQGKTGENLALGIWMGDMEIALDTYQHNFGPGIAISIKGLSGIPTGHWC
jgi:hypothetical protein